MKKATNITINIVEIALHIVALDILFTMKGDTQYWLNHNLILHHDVYIIQDIKAVPVYPKLLIVFWGLSILICILSIISKRRERISLWHGVLPIITIAFTDWCILGMCSTASNFWLLNGVMLTVIIIGFAKRSSIFIEDCNK